jgi:hypothetical protein
MAEKINTYKVGTGEAWVDTKVKAHQFAVDEHGVLSFYTYQEKVGYSVPQLTTTAMFAQGAWYTVIQEVEDDV